MIKDDSGSSVLYGVPSESHTFLLLTKGIFLVSNEGEAKYPELRRTAWREGSYFLSNGYKRAKGRKKETPILLH